MAVAISSMWDFCRATRDDDASVTYARSLGLPVDDELLKTCDDKLPRDHQERKIHCLLGTLKCQGRAYCTTVAGGDGKEKDHVIRCGSCKKKTSARNTVVNLVVKGPTLDTDARSFFCTSGSDGRSQTRLTIGKALGIVYAWMNGLSGKQSAALLDISEQTLVDWRNYIREASQAELEKAPPMGSEDEEVQADESYLRGKRKKSKNRRARPLKGDKVACARENYGNAVKGPWVFGVVHKRADGRLDLRVPRAAAQPQDASTDYRASHRAEVDDHYR